MSVIIKGMEMPASCAVCRLWNGFCPFSRELLHPYANLAGERLADCPLVETKETEESKKEQKKQEHVPGQIDKDDHIYKLLLRCKRDVHKPDMHSFTIKIKGGTAFVEAQNDAEVVIHAYLREDDKNHTFALGYMAAANKLDQLGADFSTVEM